MHKAFGYTAILGSSHVKRKRTFQLEDLEDDSMDGFNTSLVSCKSDVPAQPAHRVRQGASDMADARQGLPERQDGVLFFRPLERISHLTLLGDVPRKCDFVCQLFHVINKDTDNVVVGSAFGQPKLTVLTHVPYETLSSKLKIWEFDDAGFHVIQDMLPGHHLDRFALDCQ